MGRSAMGVSIRRGTLEAAHERAARVAALRRAYLEGTLSLVIPLHGKGLDRLLEELIYGSAGPISDGGG